MLHRTYISQKIQILLGILYFYLLHLATLLPEVLAVSEDTSVIKLRVCYWNPVG